MLLDHASTIILTEWLKCHAYARNLVSKYIIAAVQRVIAKLLTHKEDLP